MSTRREPGDVLHLLGWKLDGPRQTAGGWKATIQRGAVSILQTSSTAEQVLEDLLQGAQEHAGSDQP